MPVKRVYITLEESGRLSRQRLALFDVKDRDALRRQLASVECVEYWIKVPEPSAR